MSAVWPSDTSRAMTSIVSALIVDTPLASPSSPSIRFTELVIPTIHSTVMGTDAQPRYQYGSSLKMLGLDRICTTTP